MQFQNTHAGMTIFSVHSQHLKSSSSAFRPALSNLWLPLVSKSNKPDAFYARGRRLKAKSFGYILLHFVTFRDY